jgi:hypothetical protein
MAGWVLDGLDEVPWAQMTHAYGPADEIPSLVLDLIDPDPAKRETALDGFYGAVHHQGDVYECTLAVLPFLVRLVQVVEWPGRGPVIALIASIGGEQGEDWDAPDPDSDATATDSAGLDGAELTTCQRARLAVAAEQAVWVGLLDDQDSEVRDAATLVLTVCRNRADADAAVAALRRRYAVEPVTSVRSQILTAIGRLGSLADPAHVATWLHELISRENDPLVQLTAVARLARISGPELPGSPGVDVAAVESLLERAYAQVQTPPEPAGFETNTLIGMLRVRHEADQEGRTRPDMDSVMRSVVAAYGDRVDIRTQLLSTALRSPDRERRLDALYPASNLVRGWRGDHTELVELIGDQLSAENQLAGRAVSILSGFGRVAAPAAEALHALLLELPREGAPSLAGPDPWIVQDSSGRASLGSALTAFARTGDLRALPMLAWVLQRPQVPTETVGLVASFGAAATDLVPLLRARLLHLPEDDEGAAEVSALAEILGAEALPELLAVGPSKYGLEILGDLGAAAAEALPQLREYTLLDDPELALAAAVARRRIEDACGIEPTSDPVAAAVVMRLLDSDHPDAGPFRRLFVLGLGFKAISALGPAAFGDAPVLARLNELAHSDPQFDRYAWFPLTRAEARWALTGEHRPALDITKTLWPSDQGHATAKIVEFWTKLGPAAAEVEPLLVTELADPRRVDARDQNSFNADVNTDERFQDAARNALAVVRADRT